MATVLKALVDCGYGIAWRVLDAQHFGVPQRRRRIFIVGCLGDSGRASAEVLFEPEGGAGDLAESPEARPEAAGGIADGVATSGPVVTTHTHTHLNASGWREAGLPDRRGSGSWGTPDHPVVRYAPKISPTLVGGSDNPASHGKQNGSDRGALVVAALTANGVGTCGADDNQAQAGHLIVDHGVYPERIR